MNAIKNILKIAATITFFSIVTRMLGFFFRIYLSRTLGAETMGIYQVAISIFVVFLACVSSGIPLTVSAFTARAGTENKSDCYSYVSAAAAFNIVLSLTLIAIVVIGRKFLEGVFTNSFSATILMMLLPAVFFSAVADAFKGNIWGNGKYLTVSAIELGEQITRIALCVILLTFVKDRQMQAKLAALSLSIACGLSGLVMIGFYFKKGGKLPLNTEKLSPVAKMSIPITIMRMASSLIGLLMAIIIPSRLIASGMNDSQAMYLYGSSVGMSLGFLYSPITLSGSLAMALVPELNRLFEKKDYLSINAQAQNAVTLSTIIAFALFPFFFVAGKEIGIFIFDNYTSGQFLQKASFCMIPLTLEQITSSMMNSIGLERTSFVNFLLGNILLIVCVWFLPKYMGIDALIVGLFLSNTLSTVLHLLAISKKTTKRLSIFKMIVLNLSFCVPACAICMFVMRWLTFAPLFITLALAAFLSVSFVILLNMCFGYLNFTGIVISGKKHKSNLLG